MVATLPGQHKGRTPAQHNVRIVLPTCLLLGTTSLRDTPTHARKPRNNGIWPRSRTVMHFLAVANMTKLEGAAWPPPEAVSRYAAHT